MDGQDDSQHWASEEDLERLRKDLVGICWWCGSLADSQEHKFKRSDLARILGEDGLYWGGDNGGKSIRSIRKSPEVRFTRTMCQNCNNSRSQPFDLSYDVFSDYIASNMPRLWELDGLNMVEVYGTDWPARQIALGRYYAKHFGSLMVDSGVPAPLGLIEFLDGAPYARDCGMYFVKDEALHFGYTVMTEDGFDGIGHWISPGIGHLDKDGNKLVQYEIATRVGFVGVLFIWEEGSGRTDSFLGHVEPILNLLPMPVEQRRHLEKLARQARARER